MKTGDQVEIVFTYEDGSTFTYGSWIVPHDSDYSALERGGNDIGFAVLYELAKQPSKTVSTVEIRKVRR